MILFMVILLLGRPRRPECSCPQQVMQSVFLHGLLAVPPVEQPLRSRNGRSGNQTQTGDCESDGRSRCQEEGQNGRCRPDSGAAAAFRIERPRPLFSHESRALPASLNASAMSGMVLCSSSLANSSLHGSASMRRAIQPSFASERPMPLNKGGSCSTEGSPAFFVPVPLDPQPQGTRWAAEVANIVFGHLKDFAAKDAIALG